MSRSGKNRLSFRRERRAYLARQLELWRERIHGAEIGVSVATERLRYAREEMARLEGELVKMEGEVPE